jgi:hypothetical protein
MMPKVRQGTLDAAVTPGRILLGHADHELFHLLRDIGASKHVAVLAAIKFLSDESLTSA